MNDKCASGTGATIDKCMIKVGMPPEEVQKISLRPDQAAPRRRQVRRLRRDRHRQPGEVGHPQPRDHELAGRRHRAPEPQRAHPRQHPEATRCCCWAAQHLPAVPGRVLAHADPETWKSRGYDGTRRRARVEELIFTPDNAQYYAALRCGGLRHGRAARRGDARYRGLDALKRLHPDRPQRGSAHECAIGPLVDGQSELDEPSARSTPFRPSRRPGFSPARSCAGSSAWMAAPPPARPCSSTTTMARSSTRPTRCPRATRSRTPRRLFAEIQAYVTDFRARRSSVMGFGATGYAADVLEESVKADVNIVETVAHMMSAIRYVPDADVVCDIGGQDIKVLFLPRTSPAAATSRTSSCPTSAARATACCCRPWPTSSVSPVRSTRDTAFSASLSAEVQLRLCGLPRRRPGELPEGGLHPRARCSPVWPRCCPRTSGSTWCRCRGWPSSEPPSCCRAAPSATWPRSRPRSTTSRPACPDAKSSCIRTAARPGPSGRPWRPCAWSGAAGAPPSSGSAAIDLAYTTTNDESTVCHFCPNECSRTFIDTQTPDGRTSRYISGFSLREGHGREQGRAQAADAGAQRHAHAVPQPGRGRGRSWPSSTSTSRRALPAAGTAQDRRRGARGLSLVVRVARKAINRGFQRFAALDGRPAGNEDRHAAGAEHVQHRPVLPDLLRDPRDSPHQRGLERVSRAKRCGSRAGKYGSIDPCYPSKVIQAHIHELIFHAHTDPKKRRGPLDYIFFPCLTHVPTWLSRTRSMDSASCPIVAGSPNVIKAAFTKEVDFFARAGIEYIDRASSSPSSTC